MSSGGSHVSEALGGKKSGRTPRCGADRAGFGDARTSEDTEGADARTGESALLGCLLTKLQTECLRTREEF